MKRRILLFVGADTSPVPKEVHELGKISELSVTRVRSRADVLAWISRSYPGLVVIDGSVPTEQAFDLCRTIKGEPFTAVVPVVILFHENGTETAVAALEAGADEVITPTLPGRERLLRLRMALHRADRDVSVHPTTLLPGTVQIERDIAERLRSGEPFAVCYADLDHFKEFNDRYGYNNGDCVILIVSRILRDVVRAHAPNGFVGHIGGDDFIFNLPLDFVEICCEEIIEIFDQLLPYQYSQEDRARGHFFGKDRRGHIYRVPLMTLSIGIVTNQHRSFDHPAEVSRVATEMKTFAKTKEGSVFIVDMRSNTSTTTYHESQ